MISVVMPVFNGEKYLGEAIESILGQTFQDFEFLIITDPSKDRSLEICEDYAKKDSRIRIIPNRFSKNISGALNTGFEEAKGEFIARMDCDDISFQSRFEKQLKVFSDNPSVGVCATNGFNIDENGKPQSAPWWINDALPVKWRLMFETALAHPTVMFRCALIRSQKVKYADPPAEDFELWTRLAPLTEMVRTVEPLFYYRLTTGSLFQSTLSDSNTRSADFARELAEYYFERKLPDIFLAITNFGFNSNDKFTSEEWVDLFLLSKQFSEKISNKLGCESLSQALKSDFEFRVLRAAFNQLSFFEFVKSFNNNLISNPGLELVFEQLKIKRRIVRLKSIIGVGDL